MRGVEEVQLIFMNKVKAEERPQITCSRDAAAILRNHWNDGQIDLLEEFKILLLDRSNRVMSIAHIATGGITATYVDLRIVFATALKRRANSVILAHNHPSGNLNPSEVDITLTKKFDSAGSLLDIAILDHLILTREGYYSISDRASYTY